MTSPLLPAVDLEHVVEHTSLLWEEARGGRIFLTGGTGFFGAWLVESFQYANQRLDLDAQLVVLTRDPEGARRRLSGLAGHSGVTVHGGDVRDFQMPGGSFDFVLHGATESSAQLHPGDERHMFDTIVDGTRRVLDLARSSGARRFLLVSSGAVYGAQPPDVERMSEAQHGAPDVWDARSAYAEGKRAAEMLCAIEAASGPLSTRSARCFAFAGPHLPLDAHFAIGNFIRDALAGGPIRVRGDGTAVRSYMYMSDLAIWLWTLLLSPVATGAYNVGSENAISILDTARTVASVCAPDTSVHVATHARPGAVTQRYVPCTERARHELALRQHVGLPEAIRRTSGWLRRGAV